MPTDAHWTRLDDLILIPGLKLHPPMGWLPRRLIPGSASFRRAVVLLRAACFLAGRQICEGDPGLRAVLVLGQAALVRIGDGFRARENSV